MDYTQVYLYSLNMCAFTKNHAILSCSKLVISVTEHVVEVADKLSTTAVVFFRSERVLKCKGLHFSILSDLKKTTAVVESLSATSTRCSVTEITSLLQDSTNRMRNLHQIMQFYIINMFKLIITGCLLATMLLPLTQC